MDFELENQATHFLSTEILELQDEAKIPKNEKERGFLLLRRRTG